MSLSRRQALGGVMALPLAARVAQAGAAPALLPDKDAFAASPLTYLDNGSTHPISLGARAAVDAYMASRMLADMATDRPRQDLSSPLGKFARLVNADADELTWVQSTTMGEQMVLRAMGFPATGGRIVTDTLHFHASFPMYMEMGRQGVDVAWVKAREGRIMLEDMARAITPGTRLVVLSLVSTYNGFTHDLKAVCQIAHAAGALVYADIIHAAGAIPMDLHASGVDFAACATYKWLMGDFGLGFLYVRRGVADRLPRTEYGYYGFSKPGAPPGIGLSPPETHVYPLDPPGIYPVAYAERSGAIGHFATGTYSHAVPAQLDHSLDYIAQLGVPAIQAHAQTLIAQLREELPRKGYRLITPPDARSPMLSCLVPNARALLVEPLVKAQVRLSLHDNHFRVSPSVHNDQRDIERLLAALPYV